MRQLTTWTAHAVVFCALIASSVSAHADDCKLERFASIDADFSYERILIPIRIEGQDARLQIDTGGAWSFMRESLIKKGGYRTASIRSAAAYLEFHDAAGQTVPDYAVVPAFELAGVTLKNREFIITPDGKMPDISLTNEVGTFGQNFLTNYDLEIDPAGNKVSLFLANDCEGGVVYWNSNYFEIPFKREGALLYVNAEIDGEKVRALIDTGASVSVLDLDTARRLFNIEPTADDEKNTIESLMVSGEKLKISPHSFKTLDIGDVNFRNVTIGIAKLGDTYDGGPRLIVGMDMLKHLHFYISRKAKTIYATLANERDLAPPEVHPAP